MKSNFYPIILWIAALLFPFMGVAQDTTMVVTPSGDVGIGTTSPDARLEVRGPTLIVPPDYTANASGSSGGIEIRGNAGTYEPGLGLDNGSQQWNIVVWSDNNLRFVKSSGSTFTPFVISDNSFANALFIGDVGVGVGTDNPQEMLDVDGNIAVSGTVDSVDISDFYDEFLDRVTNYSASGGLNQGFVNVTTTWTELNIGTQTFTKNHDGSTIEVNLESRVAGGIFNGNLGVRYQLRINGQTATIGNEGSVNTTTSIEKISLFGIFKNLPAGTHTVSVWARAAPSGTSNGVSVDPGGWGGRILIKETW